MYKVYAFNEESFEIAEGNTTKEVINEAIDNINEDYIIEENGKKIIYITIGEGTDYEDVIDVDYFIDEIRERAYSEYTEDGLEYLDNISEESKKWLNDKLYAVWDEFKKREKIGAPFYHIDNEKTYKIYLKQIEECWKYEIINYEEEK